MKRIISFLLLFVVMIGMTTMSHAAKVAVDIYIDDPVGNIPVHRGPILPDVFVDDYMLRYEGLVGEHVLQILQEGIVD